MDEPVDGEKEFLEYMVPEDCLPTGIVAAITYFTPEGESGYCYYINTDGLTFEQVGLLENLKEELLRTQRELNLGE